MPKTYEELLGFKKRQGITKERLHKPIASENRSSETSERSEKTMRDKNPAGSKLAIDLGSMPTEYWQYCDCNDAKRNWIRVKFGMSHRGTTAQLKRDVKKIQSNLNLIKRMPPEVMAELKLKIEGRKDE